MFDFHISTIYSIANQNLVNEYEILRKALLENNVNITKRIINDIKINTETVLNLMPNEENSLLYL